MRKLLLGLGLTMNAQTAYMFSRAESFNQDISSWDVSSVTNCIYFSNTLNRQYQNLTSLTVHLNQ
jgi:surface protein